MSIGAQLRTAREAKGLSIESLSRRTRVQQRALAAIEVNDISALPPRPFGRGFVRAYAEEVDLDPGMTVREYFAQFPPTTAPNPARGPHPVEKPEPALDLSSHWTGLAIAGTILMLVVATAVVLGRRNDKPAVSEAVGTTGSAPVAAKPAPQPAPAERPVDTPRPAPAPAPATPLNLAFNVTGPCWVTATVDGERKIYRMLQAGERETLTAQKEIAIRFGNAAAVTWSINGRQGAPLGNEGVVRNLTITPQNAASVR